MCNKFSNANLQQALAGSLPPTEEETLQLHLSTCDECNATLEEMAGGKTWCDNAATLLIHDELDESFPQDDAWSEVDFTVEHLEPTDQANDLGKLGGYDVQEVVGRGGMGVVLKAYDRELKRCVAIKVLAPHLAQSSLAKRRFTREAQAAAAVVHPNVLAIHQVQPTGPLPFLVMPFVAGESLADRIKYQGSLELKEILRIGMQAAAGLAAAHEQGLVHRDVKPANILLEKGVERAVLTDFGLARAADDLALTRYGVIAGTPQYMSPEQARGEALDGRSDLFSLGCVLYEMATGVSPFLADSTFATLRRLVDDEPVAMAARNPELPTWFVAIVNRLLEKDPTKRFSSAYEVSELLERCLAHLQQPAHVALPAAIGTFGPASARRGGRRWIFVSTLLLMLALGGGGAFMAITKEPSSIGGEWTSDEWGDVTLKETAPGEYEGTYGNTLPVLASEKGTKRDEDNEGKIRVAWNRIERRYNGTWREGKNRFGTLSVRAVGDEIRGAWTTSRRSQTDPGTPALADLTWVRSLVSTVQIPPGGKLLRNRGLLEFGPVIERTVNDISSVKDSFLNLERGELLTPPESVRELEEMRTWAEANDADVAGCGDAGGRGLRIFGGFAGGLADWDATAIEVEDEMRNWDETIKKYKKTNPGLQGPREMGFANMWVSPHSSPSDVTASSGTDPRNTFFIGTRHGTMGLLQIIGFTPTIVVRADYPGASPKEIVDKVATPIERKLKGVEGMLAISSQSAADGKMQVTVTFKLGTDLDKAQALVQELVSKVETELPEEVRRLGVTTMKASADSGNAPGVEIRYKLLRAAPNRPKNRVPQNRRDRTEVEGESVGRDRDELDSSEWKYAPAVERSLEDISTGKDCFLNLESGNLLSPPPSIANVADMLAWAESNDADLAACEGGRGLKLLSGLAGYPIDFDAAPKRTVEAVRSMEGMLEQVESRNPRSAGTRILKDARVRTNASPFYFSTRNGKMGLLQFVDDENGSQAVRIRYKLLVADEGGSRTKRQRFAPVIGVAIDTSWSIFEPPSILSKTDWAVMASMTIGGEARIQLPGDEQPRCVIKLIKGDDESVVVGIEDVAKASTMEVSIARGQSAAVIVDGEGYSIAYNPVQVSANDPDTSPFAHIVLRRMQPPRSRRDEKGLSDVNSFSGETPYTTVVSDSYSALLWGAGSFHLIGCSVSPSLDHSWWSPLGHPLAERPYDQLGASVAGNAASVPREFVVRLGSLPPDADVKWDIPAALGSAGGGAPMQGGQSLSNLRAIAAQIPVSLRKIDIRCGIAIGEWHTIAERAISGNSSGTSALGGTKGSAVFAPGSEHSDQFVQLVSHDVVDRAVRMVIVDREGKTITAIRTANGSAGNVQQLEATFDAATLSSAQRIEFQARPYEWFVFEDVHVYPNADDDKTELSPSAGESTQPAASEATSSMPR